MCQSFVGVRSTFDVSGIVHVILNYWGQALLVKYEILLCIFWKKYGNTYWEPAQLLRE